MKANFGMLRQILVGLVMLFSLVLAMAQQTGPTAAAPSGAVPTSSPKSDNGAVAVTANGAATATSAAATAAAGVSDAAKAPSAH